MNEQLALDAEIGERRHRAVRAGHAEMTHSPSGLGTETGGDHLVIAPERTVEEQERCARYPCGELVVHCRACRDVEKALSSAGRLDHQPDRILRPLGEALLDMTILEIERDFSWHAERLED